MIDFLRAAPIKVGGSLSGYQCLLKNSDLRIADRYSYHQFSDIA